MAKYYCFFWVILGLSSCISKTLVISNESQNELIVYGNYPNPISLHMIPVTKDVAEYFVAGYKCDLLLLTDSTIKIKIQPGGFLPLGANKSFLNSYKIHAQSKESFYCFLNPLYLIGNDTLKFENEELLKHLKYHPRLKSKDYKDVPERRRMQVYLEYK